jgi:hypothetical protein
VVDIGVVWTEQSSGWTSGRGENRSEGRQSGRTNGKGGPEEGCMEERIVRYTKINNTYKYLKIGGTI